MVRGCLKGMNQWGDVGTDAGNGRMEYPVGTHRTSTCPRPAETWLAVHPDGVRTALVEQAWTSAGSGHTRYPSHPLPAFNK